MKCQRFAYCLFFIVAFCFRSETAWGQQTVFGIFRNKIALGDKYYQDKNFTEALKLYLGVTAKNSDINLRIARCYYELKQYSKAIYYYDQHLALPRVLPWNDVYTYAEVQAAIGNYGKAITYYQQYLIGKPDDALTIQKIWRLTNAHYLYEDSAYCSIRRVSFNTGAGELCAVPYGSSVVFMSNRQEPELIQKVNAAVDAPFYQMYKARVPEGDAPLYGKVSPLPVDMPSRFNMGPAAFYDHDQKMVFVATGDVAGVGGRKNLQLFFADLKKGQWTVSHSFRYNSRYYSISEPAISEDGKTLYFSSDMGGGFGGRDLYRSNWVDSVWTTPVNLGETINTPDDEVFPFIHQGNRLYFASNGHAGLGGLDIYQSAILPDGFSEPRNEGYPINTSYDDFAMVIDPVLMHGYFSSNRGSSGYNDDVYEFEMDMQRYPLTFNGLIKYKEHAWSDSASVRIMPHAIIYVQDKLRRETVSETVTNGQGEFSVVLPYFSDYAIRVIGDDGKEYIVALDIPKYQKGMGLHEIVIVRDFFRDQ